MNARAQAKRILPFLVILVGIGVYYSLVNSNTERIKPALTEKIWLVEVIEARRQDLSPSITLYGRIEAPEQLDAAAPGGGFIDRVLVRNGMQVVKGERLITMDRRDFESALLQARADLHDIDNQIDVLQIRHLSNIAKLETERILLSLANDEVDRQIKLQQQKLSAATALNNAHSLLGKQQLAVISRELDVDSFPAQLQILKARRDGNRARLDEARLAIERADIRAPFDAIISEVAVSVGDRVSLGQTLVSLYSIDSLEIRAHLPASYSDAVQRSLALGEVLEARALNRAELGSFPLLRLAGEAQATGIDIYFQTNKSPAQMRPGELISLSLKLPRKTGVIAVPYQAIYGNSTLYLVSEGRLQAVEVASLGQIENEQGQVLLLIQSDRIENGNQIVTTHLPNAVSGLKVRIEGDATGQ